MTKKQATAPKVKAAVKAHLKSGAVPEAHVVPRVPLAPSLTQLQEDRAAAMVRLVALKAATPRSDADILAQKLVVQGFDAALAAVSPAE